MQDRVVDGKSAPECKSPPTSFDARCWTAVHSHNNPTAASQSTRACAQAVVNNDPVFRTLDQEAMSLFYAMTRLITTGNV